MPLATGRASSRSSTTRFSLRLGVNKNHRFPLWLAGASQKDRKGTPLGTQEGQSREQEGHRPQTPGPQEGRAHSPVGDAH